MTDSQPNPGPPPAYIPCPTLDQLYAQRSVGPTPFASPMAPHAAFEPPRVVSTNDRRAAPQPMEYKVMYPVALRSAHEKGPSIGPSRSDTNFYVADSTRGEAGDTQHPMPACAMDTAQAANVFWQMPPPVFEAKPSELHEHPKLPRDTLHPLLSALQAAENAKAAQFTPQVAYLANASRRGPPCPAHRPATAGGATGGAGGAIASPGDEAVADPDGELDMTIAGATRIARFPRKGDVKTAVGRAYNSEGGFHDPDQYASKIIDFAASQPASLTAIAAKALASAIHDKPSHSIVSNVQKSRARRPITNSGPHGTNANRHEFIGLGDASNAVVPPSAAFRSLSEPLRAVLSKRERDARHKVAAVLERHYTPVQPPPLPADLSHTNSDRGGCEAEAPFESSVFANQKAPAVDPADEEELDYISDGDTDAVLAAGPGSRLGLWHIAIRRKASRVQNADELRAPGEAVAERVTAGQRLRVLTPHLVSMYSSLSSRAQVSTFLNGVGLRMDDSLTQTKPPSQSSFLKSPQRLHAIKQFANIPRTPSNSFCFDDKRLNILLSDKGFEMEDIFLEGCTHLAEGTFASIARHCPKLKLLNVAGCTQLADDTVCAIAGSSPQLVYLNISECPKLSGTSLAAILEGCPDLFALCASSLPQIDKSASIAFSNMFRTKHLAALDLSFCVGLTDEALICVALHCRCLEMLDISGCRSVGDAGVASVGSSCSRLKMFKLKLCSQLTTASLRVVTLAPRNLSFLDVSGCVAIDPPTLTEVLERMPGAETLLLGGCPLLDDSAVRAITRCCKRLKALNLASAVGVSLASCMELIHELRQLRKLTVSESSISNAEVVMLSAVRESCRIVRNQYREAPPQHISAYKTAEPKKKKKEVDPKKNKKK